MVSSLTATSPSILGGTCFFLNNLTELEGTTPSQPLRKVRDFDPGKISLIRAKNGGFASNMVKNGAKRAENRLNIAKGTMDPRVEFILSK